jgi:hypothetical protein
VELLLLLWVGGHRTVEKWGRAVLHGWLHAPSGTRGVNKQFILRMFIQHTILYNTEFGWCLK